MSAPEVAANRGTPENVNNPAAGKKKAKNEKFIRIYDNPNQKTPYQGSRRTFGYFHCLTCKTDWTSANTWANKGQDCFSCMKNTYPYRQMPLLRGERKGDVIKPHPEGHCEMCKDLKEPCKNKWIIDQKNISGAEDKSGSGDAKKAKKNRRPRRRNRKNQPATSQNEE